jgi:hypothetical protein
MTYYKRTNADGTTSVRVVDPRGSWSEHLSTDTSTQDADGGLLSRDHYGDGFEQCTQAEAGEACPMATFPLGGAR